MRRTLAIYISKEIWGIFFTCLIVFIFIMLAFEMIDMTELMVNQGVAFSGILKLILCVIPKVILTAMPAACLMGVLLAYMRMSVDNEIIAIYSSGLSLYQTLLPVVIFSVVTYLLSSLMAIYLVPYGSRTDKSVFYEILQEKTDISVKERVFTELSENVVFYVNSFSQKDGYMEDIFMVDKREKPVTTIVAKKGKIIPKKGSSTVSIRFYDAYMYTGKTTISKHETFNYTVDLSRLISAANLEKEPEDMYINELLAFIKSGQKDENTKRVARLKLLEMISVPVSIFLLGLIGAPLGAHVRDRGRIAGIVIGLILFLCYYISIMAVRYLIELGSLNPGLGIWIPVLFLLLFCSYLFFSYSRNLTYGIFDAFFVSSR